MMKLKEQQLEDLLIGAKILGVGGGGEIEWAKPMIQEVFKRGKEFILVNPSEVPGDELVAIVSRVGGGVSEEEMKIIRGYKRVYERPELIAVKELSRYLNKPFYALIPSEIGAGNVIIPMYVAAMLDIFTIDGDACGRAKPEIAISTTNIAGIPIAPLSIATHFGDVIIIDRVINDMRAEHLCRHIARISGGIAGVCRCPMQGIDVQRAIVCNSITRAISIGRSVREAQERGKNPVEALINAIGGVRVFEGKVSDFKREEKGAFVWGNIVIQGEGEFKNHTLKVFFKNEHLISWLDNKPFITCPDLICIVDAKTAFGLSNWGKDFTRGRKVVVIGVPAPSIWRTERGLELFGPKHFDYEIPHIPLEEIIKKFTNYK